MIIFNPLDNQKMEERTVTPSQCRAFLVAAGWEDQTIRLLLDRPPLPRWPIDCGKTRLHLVKGS
jgi:hypothetical protein